ncbi:TIGR01777 family oxidoreductase [Pseudoteredinibacter isoporae]|uniref:TIGR01777 family oxidoreductase n=1 Tax=Pseudoteredinibacter isoporae TaxID=570281 RepID=UPI00310969D4
MNILVTGASGFIAQALIPHLLADGHTLWAWTRSRERCQHLYGTQLNCVSHLNELFESDGVVHIDAMINLAGEGIAEKRWSEQRKAQLLNSRIDTTSSLLELIQRLDRKPKVLLSASAIGFYGSHDGDEPIAEDGAVSGGFTHELCHRWEEEAEKAREHGVRVCSLRTGIVLGHGGALAKMRLPFLLGMGGRVGSGAQWMSWIHMADEVRAIQFLLSHEQCSGAFNLTAPNAVQNLEFTQRFAHSLHRPSWIPLPEFVPKLMLGEGAELLLEGQRVYPKRLLQEGFQFNFETIDSAFKDLASRH